MFTISTIMTLSNIAHNSASRCLIRWLSYKRTVCSHLYTLDYKTEASKTQASASLWVIHLHSRSGVMKETMK